jgi:hypothetical protein
MDSMVFRAALRASAKVALTATLASCGGSLQTSGGDDHDAAPRTRGADDGAASIDSASAVDSTAFVDSTVVVDSALAVDVTSPMDVVTRPLACNAPPVASLLPELQHPGVTISDATFECCIDLLAPELQSDAVLPMLGDAAAHDPNVVGCCAVAIYRLDGDYGNPDAAARDQGDLFEAGLGPRLAWDELQSCCPPLGYPDGPTCSPWGPPMPPAMPGVA